MALLAKIVAPFLIVWAALFGSHVVAPQVGSSVFLPYQGGTGTGTAPNTGGKLLISTSGGVYAPAYLTAGSNITIASSSGGVTITGTGSSGLSYIQVREAGSSFGNVSSLSFSASGFNITNSGRLSTIGLDYTNGPASRSIAQTIPGNWYFSGGASFSGAFTFPSNVTGKTQSSLDNSTKYATTAYVDSAVTASNPAVAVQAATTQVSDTSSLTYNNGVAGIGATLTGTANTPITVDGYTFTAVNQRLLVKNDTQSPSGSKNGVYYVTTIQALGIAPILTRALDYDMPSDINNTGAVPVVNGTANANTSWLLTSAVATVGTDPLTYAQFSYAPSDLARLSVSNTFAGLNIFSVGATSSTNFEAIGYASASKGFFGGNKQIQFSTTIASISIPFEVSGTYASASSAFFGGNKFSQFTPTIASISIPFEVSGAYASASKYIGGNASHSFLGSLSGPTTGTLSVGTSNNPLKTLWSNIVHIVTQFFKPTTTSTTTTLVTTGESIYNTASKSDDTYDGTSQRVNPDSRCFTYQPSPLTAIGQQIGKRFLDPFTLDAIAPIASPSGNGIGWNLYKGVPGTVTTAIFSANKAASSSTSPKYTTFAQSTLGDGDELDIKVTSASAIIKQFSVTICGHYTK